MIVYRDYRSSSDSIVKIFNNKIEFYNPGRLPDTISVEDLLSNTYRSTPRNKLLADFFKDMGLIEKYGSGIQRVINSFNEAHMTAPEFKNISNGFMVTVFSDLASKVGEKVDEKLTENQRIILKWMKTNPYISATSLAEKLGISRRKTETNIGKLRELGPHELMNFLLMLGVFATSPCLSRKSGNLLRELNNKSVPSIGRVGGRGFWRP